MLLCGISSFDTVVSKLNPFAWLPLVKKCRAPEQSNMEVVYGVENTFPFHHLLTVKIITSRTANLLPKKRRAPLFTHIYPSLPLFPFCVNRKMSKFQILLIFYLLIIPTFQPAVNIRKIKNLLILIHNYHFYLYYSF